MGKDVIGLVEVQLAKKNVYDKLLIALIFFLIFGGFGGAFKPVRLLIVFLIPITLTELFKSKKLRDIVRFETAFFSFWLIYAFVSLTWSQNFAEGVKEIVYLTINFFGIITAIVLSTKASDGLDSILKGWYYLVLFTFPIAFVEFFMGIHFPSSLHEKTALYAIGGELRRYAAINYGNLNHYNLVLIYSIPFIMFYFVKSKEGLEKKQRLLVVLLLGAIIIMNSSRAAFISLAISFFALFYFGRTNRVNKSYIRTTLISLTLVALVFGNVIIKNVEAISRILSSQGLEDNYRKKIIGYSLDALEQSNYLGVGAGSFQDSMKDYVRDYDFFSSHNLFLEVLTQYGILIFLLFIVFFIKFFFEATKSKPINKLVLFIVIATLIPSSIITSNYILDFTVWIYITSVFLVFKLNKSVVLPSNRNAI